MGLVEIESVVKVCGFEEEGRPLGKGAGSLAVVVVAGRMEPQYWGAGHLNCVSNDHLNSKGTDLLRRNVEEDMLAQEEDRPHSRMAAGSGGYTVGLTVPSTFLGVLRNLAGL